MSSRHKIDSLPPAASSARHSEIDEEEQVLLTLALRALHIDPAFLVFNKPSGLLSVPGRGRDKQDCLIARVHAQFADALVVHRLDMATSGLIVLARGAHAHRVLSRAFAERHVHKRYIAEVDGCAQQPAPDWSVIDLPLGADWPNRPRQMIDRDAGRPSATRWRVLLVDPQRRTSRLELEPLTGRTHQLRVHLHAIGHPILGDALYGNAEVQKQAKRLLLHATELGFAHPLTGTPCRFEHAPPF